MYDFWVYSVNLGVLIPKGVYLVINVRPLRSDLERHWFRTRWARLACQTFICVLRLQTDITTLVTTSIVNMSKPCCFYSNAFIIQHQCIELPQLIVSHGLHEISIQFWRMLPLKSAVLAVDFSVSLLTLTQFIALNRRILAF